MTQRPVVVPAGQVSVGSDHRARVSVVIPAHDEATVIGRCLDSLFAGIDADLLDIVVVCNGCTDGTAEVVRSCRLPVRLLELPTASKASALQAGDEVASVFPRAYLDADVVVSGRAVLAAADALSPGGPLASRPPIAYDTTGCTWIVRRYFAARKELPAVMGSLWGAGVYVLSAAGRARFPSFPVIVADDLFIDRLFEDDEIGIIGDEPVVVMAPRTARSVVRVWRRAFRGTRGEMPAPRGSRGGTRSTVRDLVSLARRGPTSAVDAAVYAAIACAARIAAAGRSSSNATWERDRSSR
jgi:glycosyltransferase involved in cell wall biosynthesis